MAGKGVLPRSSRVGFVARAKWKMRNVSPEATTKAQHTNTAMLQRSRLEFWGDTSSRPSMRPETSPRPRPLARILSTDMMNYEKFSECAGKANQKF